MVSHGHNHERDTGEANADTGEANHANAEAMGIVNRAGESKIERNSGRSRDGEHSTE